MKKLTVNEQMSITASITGPKGSSYGPGSRARIILKLQLKFMSQHESPLERAVRGPRKWWWWWWWLLQWVCAWSSEREVRGG